MLSLMLLSLAAAAPLSGPLEAWKREIEQRGGQVVVVRVETDRDTNGLRVPDDRLARLLSQDRLGRQFRRTFAMTLNYQAAEGRVHFVALNLDRAAEFKDAEEALVAHEFGHAWLDALGWRAPDLFGETEPCLAIHAGDIVQHVPIRRELQTRGIPYREHWIGSLEAALEALDQGGAPPVASTCDKLARIALWTDVRLGLGPDDWGRADEFDRAFRRAFPDLAATVDEIVTVLRAVDLTSRDRFQRALAYVRQRLTPTAGMDGSAGMLLF
jgi:hypothetical protein